MDRFFTRLRAMTPTRWLQTAVVATVLLALLLAIVTRAESGSATATRLIGAPAPAFSLRAESQGQALPKTISLAGERGHTVLLVFFFSLCPHCLNQVEAVHGLEEQEVAGGLRILYIDSPAESTSIIAAYGERLGIGGTNTPILLDASGTLAKAYGVAFYPATILVDARGIVRQVWTGETSGNSLHSAIELLATNNTAHRVGN